MLLMPIVSLLLVSCSTNNSDSFSSPISSVVQSTSSSTRTVNSSNSSGQKSFSVDYAEWTNTITTETMRSLVTIDTTSYNGNYYAKQSWFEVTGSGIIYYESNLGYLIVTNNHVSVKKNGYEKVTYDVYDYQGTKHAAILVDNDPTYDLGVLYISKQDTPQQLNHLNTFRTKKLDVGEPIVSLGQPKGQSNSITFGKVIGYYNAPTLSNSEKYESDVSFEVLVHDAKIASGSSGGPVLTRDYVIAGINYAGHSSSSESTFSDYAYAIPGDKVLEYLNKVADKISEG